MTEKALVLVLEGLPVDLERVRSRVELYFKNKRKSGGEIVGIQDYPGDKRKALLIYNEEGDLQNVLKKGNHQINVKSLGNIVLQVKLKENGKEVKKVKPPVLPRPDKVKLTLVAKPAPNPKKDCEVFEGAADSVKDETAKTEPLSLLVRHNDETTKGICEMYFEQFVSEPCLIRHGKNCWILKLSSQSDVEKVLAAKENEHGISVEVYHDRVEEGKLDPRRFILSGFDDSCKCSVVSLFIRSCSQGADNVWETLDDGDRIVVTFKEDIDAKSFLKKCSSKKSDLEIAACRLELTDSVLVQGDMSQINEETLSLYFSNKRSKGGDIRSVIWVTQDKSAVISFEDCHVAQRVVEQKHQLSGATLTAQLFDSNLQKVLSGPAAVQPDIPTSVVLPLSSELLRFIDCDLGRKREIQTGLQKLHASISIDMATQPPRMELRMAMEKGSLGELRLGPAWEKKVQREARSLLEKYKVVQLPAAMEIWEGVKSRCLELNCLDASISYMNDGGMVVVVGTQAKVKTLVEKLENILKNARDTVERKILLTSKEELDFIWDRIFDKMGNVVPSKDDESLVICLKGLKDEVSTAEGDIIETQMNVKAKLLDLSEPLVKFMMSMNLKKFERDHFAQNHISSVFVPGDKSIKMLAERDDIQRAEDKLHEVIKEEVVELTPDQVNVTKSEQWMQFFSELNKDLESSLNYQNVSISQLEAKIGICGLSSVVADVLSKIKGYLENKKPTTVDVPLKSVQEAEFLESFVDLSAALDLKVLGVTILASKTPTSPCLKVTAASEKINEAVDVVKTWVNEITTETHVYSNAGEFKVLEKNQVALKAEAKELQCKLYLSPQVTTNSQEYSFDIKGLTLTISQGYISQFASEALVCPLSSLSFNNPIAKQFLQFGGPEIKEAFDKCVKEQKSLMAGDVVMSNPGTLKAKELLCAVIPVWGTSILDSKNLQKTVCESLLKADKKTCVSIGMPMLGCGTFGFPVKQSCEAVVAGILEFIAAYQTSNILRWLSTQHLKNIYLLESDAKVVEEFRSAIEDLGYHQTTVPNKAPTTSPLTQSVSHHSPPPLPTKPVSKSTVTIAGVSVILKKGDITKETVDVIVNSNNCALDLNSGVSGAILKAAGKSVVDECKKLGAQPAGGVVLTGGGNLSCKHIAQMVGPGNAADITASMEKVFQLCESKQAASVSIPTIGTGRGGIDPKHSIKAMLRGLENHVTSQTASSSIKYIVIVAFEQNVFDHMLSYITKRNSMGSQHVMVQPKTASPRPPSKLPPNQVMIYGVRVEVRRANITTESVRAIVNTSNSDINLTGGVSGAILKAAGRTVEQECQKIRPLKGSEAGVTSGGDLPCDFIIHMLGPHSVADATVRVTNVLERCEDNQITTVSFPAVGTGGGGLSGIDAIGAMLQGIRDHLSQCSSTVLKLIYIVMDQDKVLKDVQQGLDQWKSKPMDEDDTDDDDDDDDDYDDDDDEDYITTSEDEDEDASSQTSNTVEAKIGPLKVKVLCGDITKENTDAVVSSTNTSLNLNSGVSGAILKAAGQTVVDECTSLGTQPSDGVVITKPGNLRAKHIIHMVGQTKGKEITSSMLKVLKMCEDKKIQSVSFPALGTGAGNIGPLEVGKAMMQAVDDFLLASNKPVLTSIHIVIFQTKMMKDFEEVMKKYKKVTPKPSAAKKTSTPLKDSKSSPAASSTPSKAPMCLASATAAVPFPVMEVEVVARSADSLLAVKKFLDKQLSEECSSEDVWSSHLALLLEPEKEAILALSWDKQVRILLAASRDRLSISGKKDDVLASVIQIKDFLTRAKERASRTGEERRMRETVRWEAEEGGGCGELDSSLSYELELAFHDKRSYTYSHQGETYTVDLSSMLRTDGKGTISRVKRTLRADGDTAFIQLPPSWTKMGSKRLDIVNLVPNSQEYQEVEKEFLRTCKNPSNPTKATIKVVQIQRVQSRDQWQTYAVKKQALDTKYPNQKNEMNLYHGTTKDICQKVNTNGFNRSFCGRNATYFGNGTYFAKETWYSCQDTYSNPDASGLKYMYRARVLVGKPCQGRKDIKEPDPLDPKDPGSDLHDCAVDNLQQPFIYVVFCDAGAYPDYLISFKTA